MNDLASEGAGEARACISCKEIKPFTVEHWPEMEGRPSGKRCRLCERAYKKIFDRKAKQTRVAARIQQQVALEGTPAMPASMPTVPESKANLPVELPLRQLEITKALRVGAALLNSKAQEILERLIGYAASPASPHHEWALRLIAERLLPKKLYEDLGAKDAGIKVGEGGGYRPSVTIIVQPATVPTPGEPPAVKVIDGEAERVN